MSGESNTFNMNLVLPGVGVTAGPTYATDINASLTIIDGHNHSSGSGVQINPAGLNINADLTMAGNNLTKIRTLRLQAQATPLALPADLGCIYEVGNDLYYNDGVGNQVRITQAGAVVGTPGSISNLTPPANASFVAGSSSFVWQSAANTPANLDAGSIVLRNLTVNSLGLTLSPPTLSANYTLTLPQLPVSPKVLLLDASGNITAPYTVDSTIVINASTIGIAAGGISTTLLANASVTSAKFAAPLMQRNVLAGSGNFIVPANVTVLRVLGMAGGGGGGGAGLSAFATGGGGAGGGAADAFEYTLAVTPGASVAYAIGTGGAGGPTSNTDGVAGISTTFGTLTWLPGLQGLGGSASGGIALKSYPAQGVGGNGGAQSFNGIAGSGSISNAAQRGGFTGGSTTGGGGGGSSSLFGIGGIGGDVSGGSNGAPGTGFGAGGGGAAGGGNASGGAGTPGTIIVSWVG